MILFEDELGGDARWSKLAEMFPEPRERLTEAQHAIREDALQSAYWRIGLYVGHQRDDGYLGHREALKLCRGKGWVLRALTASVRGKPPFIHQQGDTCGQKNCIDSSPPWIEGYEYRICGFLKKNASRKEKERNEAQRRELADPLLRDYVYKRDGGCCRYCRSGPMRRKGMGNATDLRRIPQLEHVDPDGLAGPDREGVALGCKRCNTRKGRRTPDEADMVLLPVPSPELIAHWHERGEQRFDVAEPGQPHPADNPSDKPPDNAETTSPTTSPGVVSGVAQKLVPSVVEPAADRFVPAGEAQEQAPDNAPEVSGPGRVGRPAEGSLSGPLGQPVRTPDAPDIWTRRSRAPDPVAGPP